MFSYGIILYLFVKASEGVLTKNCECGVVNSQESLNRIVGGKFAAPHMYPWLIYITKDKQLHCGGALINDRYVLTAGHCVKWYNKTNLAVVLGRHDRASEQTGTIIPIQNIMIHDDFASDRIHDTNDVALIKMIRSIKFSPTMSPVCLPHPVSDYTNRYAIVAGWGKISQTGKTSRFVRQAVVQIMPDDFCLMSIIGSHYSDAMLCAYSKNVDACQGDSGGPLVYERRPSKIELIGLVSWGLGCAQPGIPGVYTKIVNFLKWIEVNTVDGVYCSKN